MIDQLLDAIVPAAIILAVLAIVAFAVTWRISRANSLLARWAEEHGYQIVHQEHRLLRRGPYFFRASSDQAVYYVEVVDRQGRARRGFVRLGGWVLGLFSDAVEARWED